MRDYRKFLKVLLKGDFSEIKKYVHEGYRIDYVFGKKSKYSGSNVYEALCLINFDKALRIRKFFMETYSYTEEMFYSDEKLKKLFSHITKVKKETARFIEAAKINSLEAMKEIYQSGYLDKEEAGEKAFRIALADGKTNIVKFLIEEKIYDPEKIEEKDIIAFALKADIVLFDYFVKNSKKFDIKKHESFLLSQSLENLNIDFFCDLITKYGCDVHSIPHFLIKEVVLRYRINKILFLLIERGYNFSFEYIPEKLVDFPSVLLRTQIIINFKNVSLQEVEEYYNYLDIEEKLLCLNKLKYTTRPDLSWFITQKSREILSETITNLDV